MRVCHVTDFLGKLTERRITAEGFLEAPAKLSRANNVQSYTARELGLDKEGMAPDRILRLFRPAAEVSNPESLKSLSHKTLTLDHPPEGVNVDNWDAVAIGDVGDVRMAASGDHTESVILVKHKDGIKALNDGVCEMSVGYDFDLDLTPGKSPSGEAYDAIQRNIRANHHAIVDRARGGRGCRIADTDHQPKGKKTMKIKMADRALAGITLPGFVVTVDDAAGDAATDAVDRHLRACDDAVKAHDALATDRDAHKKRADDAEKTLAEAKTAHDAKVKELTAKILPEDAIVVLVRDHAGALDAARVLGSKELADKLGDLKTARDVRAALVGDVMVHLESLKPVAEGILKAGGEADPTKASDAALKSVIAALLPLHGTADDGEGSSLARDRNAALAGAGGGDDDTRSSARDSKKKMDGPTLARQVDALRSRGQHDAARRLMSENC